MTNTMVRSRSVATIDASVEIVGQGLSRPRARTNTHSVRCAKVAAQPSRYANPSIRPDRIGPSYGGGNRTLSYNRRITVASSLLRVLAPMSSDQRHLDCADFEFHEDTQTVLDQDSSDPNNLDADHDRIACASQDGITNHCLGAARNARPGTAAPAPHSSNEADWLRFLVGHRFSNQRQHARARRRPALVITLVGG